MDCGQPNMYRNSAFDGNHHPMNFMFNMINPMIILGSILLIILSVIVAKDANKRGLNGFLWGLIVFMLPILGLLFYLVTTAFSSPKQVEKQVMSSRSVPVKENNLYEIENNEPVANKPLQLDVQYCTNCGSECKVGYSFCNACGVKLPR